MANYDKSEIKEQLSTEDIFQLVQEMGGNPEYTNFGFIAETICHNPPHVGSRKLYYYENSTLFQCYTGGCGSFDIFELVCKVAQIQWHKEYDLNQAIRYVAYKFGITSVYSDSDDVVNEDDWIVLDNYDRIKELETTTHHTELEEYNPDILERFNYNLKLTPWLKEGISQKAINENKIGYFPGGDQITIPHFDPNGRLIGLRGRTMCKEEAERYGKYRPIKVNGILYNHPLGLNTYGLNKAKENIKLMGTAIIFESEKSVLMYQSYFPDSNIAVACCGSSISSYQIQQLIDAGAKNIVIAFDRDFEKIGDDKWKKLTTNYQKLYNKYGKYVNLSFILDNKMRTGLHDSPIDKGPEIFLELYKERKFL